MPLPRNALITGASSGIGAALAEALAARGCHVVLAARREDALQAVATRIRAAGGTATVQVLDVRDAEATVATLQRLDEEQGGLQLVVANAGVSRWTPAAEVTWEQAAAIVDVNVRGATATLLALLPRMVQRGSGHLVGISSLAGYRGLPRHAVYSASKAYLSVLLEGLRVELRGTGVAVTDVRPGFVRTPMTAKNTFRMPFLVEPEEAAEHILAGIERRAPVVTFPWQLATVVRATRLLPAGLWDEVARLGPR